VQGAARRSGAARSPAPRLPPARCRERWLRSARHLVIVSAQGGELQGGDLCRPARSPMPKKSAQIGQNKPLTARPIARSGDVRPRNESLTDGPVLTASVRLASGSARGSAGFLSCEQHRSRMDLPSPWPRRQHQPRSPISTPRGPTAQCHHEREHDDRVDLSVVSSAPFGAILSGRAPRASSGSINDPRASRPSAGLEADRFRRGESGRALCECKHGRTGRTSQSRAPSQREPKLSERVRGSPQPELRSAVDPKRHPTARGAKQQAQPQIPRTVQRYTKESASHRKAGEPPHVRILPWPDQKPARRNWARETTKQNPALGSRKRPIGAPPPSTSEQERPASGFHLGEPRVIRRARKSHNRDHELR